MQGVFTEPIPQNHPYRLLANDNMNDADKAGIEFINGDIGIDEWTNRLEKFAKANRK